MKKKGQMGTAIAGMSALVTVIILFVVLAMVSAFGSDIVQDTQNDFTANTVAWNSTVDAQAGISNLTDKFPTLATVLIGAFVIIVLVAAFGGILLTR